MCNSTGDNLTNEWKNVERPRLINNIKFTKWVGEDEMTEEEKLGYIDYKKTGGYLKTYTYKEAWRNAFNEASEKGKLLMTKLLNSDADKFYEINEARIEEEFNNTKGIEIKEIKQD